MKQKIKIYKKIIKKIKIKIKIKKFQEKDYKNYLKKKFKIILYYT